MRTVEDYELSVKDEHFKASSDPNARPRTISQLSRQPWINSVPLQDVCLDVLRARIYAKHGNLLNAFRHFDLNGDSRISYNEWLDHLPKVLGEDVSKHDCQRLWRALDTHQAGEIKMDMLCSDRMVDPTQLGVRVMRGFTVDALPSTTSNSKRAIDTKPTDAAPPLFAPASTPDPEPTDAAPPLLAPASTPDPAPSGGGACDSAGAGALASSSDTAASSKVIPCADEVAAIPCADEVAADA